MSATFTAMNERKVRIELSARCMLGSSPVSMTVHPYFNLDGNPSQGLRHHRLWSSAGHFLDCENMIPKMGNPAPVDDTALDFRFPVGVGKSLDDQNEVSPPVVSYDHYMVVDPWWTAQKPVLSAAENDLRHLARLHSLKSKLACDFFSNSLGFQLYSAKWLDPAVCTPIKQGHRERPDDSYGPYAGVCIEPSHPTNAVNRKDFPNVVISEDEEYRNIVEYHFSWL
jgi:aldose 1-epimerase